MLRRRQKQQWLVPGILEGLRVQLLVDVECGWGCKCVSWVAPESLLGAVLLLLYKTVARRCMATGIRRERATISGLGGSGSQCARQVAEYAVQACW